MRHRIELGIDLERARSAIDAEYQRLASRYARHRPELAWLDERTARFAFCARGFLLRGQIELDHKGLEVRMETPWVLRVFHGAAKRFLDQEAPRVLALARVDSAAE